MWREKPTSRDRPKSAPYPRLKNSKKTSKCQVFVYSSRKSKIFRIFFLKKLHTKKMDRVARRGSLPRAPGALTSHNAEKLKGGPFDVFQHPFCRKTSKKCRGDPLRKKNSEEKNSEKKCLAVPKKMKGSLVSPGMVCYAEKQEKPFWFSSLDQIVHFDAIIFCRTFVELFWSVRVDRKKRVTIIVAFHFMKRRLKNKMG